MLRSQGKILALAVAAGLSMVTVATAQYNIADNGTVVQSACSSCSGNASFGYPSTGCNNCGGRGIIGGHYGSGHFAQQREQFKYQIDQYKAQSEKVRARNDAWPKPFACADRQAYHNLWNGFYEGGWISHCTLIDAHFDSESGALNRLGESVVQGLMKNNPENRREIFIYDGRSNVDFHAKRQSVVDLVNRWYGDKAVQISSTNRWPIQGNGLRSETTNQLFADTTPEPVIAVPTGTGSTSDTSAGQ